MLVCMVLIDCLLLFAWYVSYVCIVGEHWNWKLVVRGAKVDVVSV